MSITEIYGIVLTGYGAVCGGRDIAEWLWRKTHPQYRVFVFKTHHGHYWRLNGSRKPLIASPLTDQLQNLHSETSPGGKPALAIERDY